MKLTLSMIVKNEEEDLPGCLDSVKDLADEMVIVDTGSTDRTVQIARKYGASVYDFEWINDFSAARNYALSKSTGDWILYLDADERLSDNSKSELKKIIKNDELLGVYCEVYSINETGGESSTMQYIRLFRNSPEIKFNGKVHEQIEKSLIQNDYELKSSNIEILHIGYNLSNEGLKEKAQRNYSLLKEQYASKPDSYTAFQLGQTLIILEKADEAFKYFSDVIKDFNFEIHHRAQAYRYLAAISLENGKINEAREFIEKGLSLNNKMPLLNIVAANVYQKLNLKVEAAEHCKKAFIQNRALLTSNEKSYFDIMVNETELFNFGINTAVLIKDRELINFFFDVRNSVKLNTDQIYSVELFHKLLNLEDISEDFLEDFEPQKFNPLVIAELSGYNSRLKIWFLVQIIKTYPGDFLLKKILADELDTAGLKAQSLEVLYEIFNGTKDISILLDIINLLSELEKFDELAGLIDQTSEYLTEYPEIQEKLKRIKLKIEERA